MLSALAKRLGAHLGLQPLPSWEQELAHKLRTLSAEREMTIEDVIARIDIEPALLREVSAALTVNETYFLRESRQFEAAVAHIVPRAERGTATVWSAGCSSGEEPYSLAILLARRALHLHSRIQIRGSDLSGACLRKARRGVYGAWSFRSAPPWLRTDYFNPVGSAEWRLDARIRERVEFFEETIQSCLARTPSESVDVIFYRNVSIYAEPASLESIFAGFRRALKSDGLLIQSVSDVRPPHDLFDPAPSPVLGLFSPRQDRMAFLEPSRDHLSLNDSIGKSPVEEPRARPAQPASVVPAPELPSTSVDAGSPIAHLLRSAAERGDCGDLDRAIDYANQALAISPHDVDALFLRGKLLVAVRNFDDAVNELRKVVFLSPGHKLARYWLAMAYVSIDMPRKAALELAELGRRLAGADPTAPLEDGLTRIEELSAAVDAQQRALQ